MTLPSNSTSMTQTRGRWQWSLAMLLGAVGGLAVLMGVARELVLRVKQSRDVAVVSVCRGRCCQIHLALMNYHDQFGCLPPAATVDKQGRPAHSWRVLLLPYLEAGDVYRDYRFDEPWDSQHNRALESRMPRAYRCPADDHLGWTTNFVAVVGDQTAFPRRGARTLEQPTGESDEILIVETSDSGIHWMEPRDLDMSTMSFQVNNGRMPSISSRHPGGANVVARGACSGEFLTNDVDERQVHRRLAHR